MSFSEKLSDNIALANQHTLLGKKAVEELVQFFKQMINVEENYAKNLESLSNYQFLLLKGTTFDACQSLKQDILKRSDQIHVFVENISQDVIKPLLFISSQIQEATKSLFSDSTKVLKLKENYLEKLSRLKEKFFKSCSECEKITISLEQPQSQNQRDKMLQKLIKHQNQLDSDLKHYENHINSWQEFILIYRPQVIPIMTSFEKIELNRLQGVKDQLRKYVVYETSYIRNLQYEIDSLAKSMEDIAVEHDLQNNCPVSMPWKNPEFESYRGTHSHYRSISMNGLTSTIPLPIQDPRWSEMTFEGSVEEMYNTEIDIITLKATQGYDLVPEDFVQFNSLIKDSLGRKAWIWSMNQKKSTPQLSDKAYMHIGELMLSVLNECERTSDFTTTKISLQYSWVFFKISSGQKHFLHKLISSHSLWTRSEVWEKVIELYINDEISEHNVYSFTSKELDRKKIVTNIVFCQLGTISEIMVTFQVNPDMAKENIQKYVSKYDLPNSDLEVLLTTITGKKEREVQARSVKKGLPIWMQELEAGQSRRNVKTLSELLTKDKN